MLWGVGSPMSNSCHNIQLPYRRDPLGREIQEGDLWVFTTTEKSVWHYRGDRGWHLHRIGRLRWLLARLRD